MQNIDDMIARGIVYIVLMQANEFQRDVGLKTVYQLNIM